MIYMKLIWCNGFVEIYAQLYWGVNLLWVYVKLIWCNGLACTYGRLTGGGPSAVSIYVHSPICETFLV